MSRCQLQRCKLPILMLMLALLSIGLLALRCMDALAPLFILLFNFFDLTTSAPSSLNLQLCVSRCAKLAPLSHLLLDLHTFWLVPRSR